MTTNYPTDKVALTSANIIAERLTALRVLFPEAFTENRIDFTKLRATLGEFVDDRPERYSFTWAGKQDAIRLLQMPTRATLVPAREESINWDTTQHLFIEGDNLEVLKLLFKPYFGQVKMIYIDPPYNSRKDFIYPDNYADPLAHYLEITKQKDDQGNLLTSNPDIEGRYHSRWLSLMYPRLFLARQLLQEDGTLFVSIDDREDFNLRQLLDEIFGSENYLTTFVWVNEGNIDNQSKFKQNHEYIVVYAKNADSVPHSPVVDPNIPDTSKLFRDYVENTIVKNGPKNPISDIVLPIGFPANFEKGTIEPKENFWPKLNHPVYIENFKTINEVVVTSGWSSKQIFEEFIKNDFKAVLDTKNQQTSFWLSPTGAILNRKIRDEERSHVLTVLRSLGTVQNEATKLSEMGLSFDYPKPSELLKYLLSVGRSKGSIVMDFFAGSGPLAQAVLELNQKDSSNRRFILVQLPEPTPYNSNARNEGYSTIADIAKERIRRVIANLQAEADNQLDLTNRTTSEDLGFRVFKLAESNIRPWSGVPAVETPQLALFADVYTQQMQLTIDSLIEGWRVEDVIYEVALKENFGLTCQIAHVPAVTDATIYRVTDLDRNQHFFICLDDIVRLATLKPLLLSSEDLFLCRDAALDDATAANLALQCRLKTL